MRLIDRILPLLSSVFFDGTLFVVPSSSDIGQKINLKDTVWRSNSLLTSVVQGFKGC